MKTNILSIGCSHSLGYWTLDNEPTYKKSWPELIYNRSNIKNYHVHIGLPGHGVIDYCDILLKLDKRGILKNTSDMVIQYTSEPRFVFYKTNNLLDKFFQYEILSYFDATLEPGAFKMFDLRNFNGKSFKSPPINVSSESFLAHVADGIFDTNKSKIDSKTRIEIVNQFEQMLESFRLSSNVINLINFSYDKIHEIAEKNEINLYEFVWPGMSDSFNLDTVDIGTQNYEDLTNGHGHVTENNIDLINNGIINLMEKNGLLK